MICLHRLCYRRSSCRGRSCLSSADFASPFLSQIVAHFIARHCMNLTEHLQSKLACVERLWIFRGSGFPDLTAADGGKQLLRWLRRQSSAA